MPAADATIDTLSDVLAFSLLGNALSAWLMALSFALGTGLAVGLLRRVLHGRAAALAAHTRSGADDLVLRMLARTRRTFVLLLALWIGSRQLELSPRADRVLDALLTVGAAVQVGLWGGVALAHFFERYQARVSRTDAGATTAIAAMSFAARMVLWSLLLLLALDNLGVDVTAMVAGLGIGGIAVALAVQNILGDLFASISIIIDRPFVVGDFIIVDDYMGTVEHVGLKTTHVRSLGGEQIVFANNDLLKTRVRNYKRMYERRVVFGFGVDYATSPAELEWLTQFLRDLVCATDKTRLERAHFARFGASSLDLEVAYWIKDPDYTLYMDIQQQLNLRIMEALAARGIRFAFPALSLKQDAPVAVQVARDRVPDAGASGVARAAP